MIFCIYHMHDILKNYERENALTLCHVCDIMAENTKGENVMPYTGKSDAEYKNDYAREKYDRIILQVQKGEKDYFKSYAMKNGESLNAFIYRAIVERMERLTKAEKTADPSAEK